MELIVKKLALGTALFALTACGSYQQLEPSQSVSAGMSKQEVLSVMGDSPVATEFYGPLEEWHYCRTGFNDISKYVAIYFEHGRVYAMKPYSVVESREGGNAFAVCDEFIKKGDYREPDIVREYRIKFK